MSLPSLTTRREFLRTTVLGSALSWTVPTFVASTFDSLQAAALDSNQVTTGKDAPILVVMQLAGGNDGLNTIVPYTNDHYYKARPALALKKERLITLNDELAVPEYMREFKELYDDGSLSIVNGVGYPNPNRSHFRSTEIWHTSSDAETFEKHGWLGRYFDNACSGCDASVGVSLAKQAPQAFTAAVPKGISISNPKKYDFMPSGGRHEKAGQEKAYRALNLDDEAEAGGTIMEVGAGALPPGADPLDFLERTAMDAQMSSDQIQKIAREGKNEVKYPNDGLSRQFQLVARLISGGMPTRIYYVSQGGYDTHQNQQGAHQRNLTQFSKATKAFMSDLKKMGLQNRVMMITFSEFGRRVAQNANGGTDHGAAAPLFLFGPKLKPGLLGNYPSLDPKDLNKGDLKHNIDFRSVYATLLQNWMGVSSSQTRKILKGNFPALPLGVKA